MKKKIQQVLLTVLALTLFNCSNDDSPIQQQQEEVQEVPETVTDADGNEYNTIRMGDQIWMLENLKTTTYNDGTPITFYQFDIHGNNWAATGGQFTNTGFYQWADTSDLSNIVDEELAFDAYGAMYNHFAIESGKLAPEGWRIPTEADFIELENFLANDGNTGNEATVLKSETGWNDSSENGTNAYGFNALPNGYINALGGPT
ncbi:MAG: fibrobacter succinogenes major paralogous domain-containing protein [Olleya sp.]